MKRSLLTLVLLSALATAAFAQNESDALRMSYDLPGGSARSIALAGAIGAMGGDLAAAQGNPGGLGLYRTSELVISPSMEFNKTSTSHYGNTSTDARARFFLSNIGLLANYGEKEGSKWKGSSFGVVYDRFNSFHFDTRATADGINSSLTQQFVNNANGTQSQNLNPFAEALAWDAFVLDPHPDTVLANQNIYVSTFSDASTFDQEHIVSSKGSTGNTNIFFAANYNDRLFIGASIGIANTRLERVTVHKESTTDANSDLQSFEYREDLTITGSGLNLKLGAVYRVGDNLRVGAAIHTPTGWSMNDAYAGTVESRFGNGDNFVSESEPGAFAYRISSPWRYMLSSAYVFGKKGLITAEYEYNDISSAKLKESFSEIGGYNFALENGNVENRFRPVHSLRAGAEFRLGLVYLRGGLGIWPSAYGENDIQHGNDLSMVAGGIGLRKQRFSLDFGMQRYTRSNNFFAYSNDLVELSQGEAISTRAVVTVAFRP